MAVINAGDFLKVTMKTRFGSNIDNPALNVFWFQFADTEGVGGFFNAVNIDPFIDAFIAQMWTPLRPAIYAIAHMDDVEVVHFSDPVKAFINRNGINSAGTSSSSNYMPFWITYSFRLNRSNGATRNGQKRFAGVPEEAQQGGTIDPAYAAILNAYAPALAEEITWVGGSGDFGVFPVIARVNATGDTVVLSQPVATAQFVRISSQDSRKR